MSDDVFENALVAAQESSISPTRLDLLQKLTELVFDGRTPGPSSYLSALWEEGTIEEIKREIARHTLPNDPRSRDDHVPVGCSVGDLRVTPEDMLPCGVPPKYDAKFHQNDPGDEDDKVRHAFGGALPPPGAKWQIGDVVPAPGDEDDKVRVFAEPVVLKSYKLPLPQIDETIARSLGWVSPDDYNKRVTELLTANNALVERRRIAEQRQRDAEALIRSLRDFLSDPVRAVLLAEIERLVSGT